MSKGKAYGIYWDYQKLCHDIVRELQTDEHLVPYERDGIDIAFSLCGTTVTFDAVLKNLLGDLVVIECKRYEKKRIDWNPPELLYHWGREAAAKPWALV